MPNDKSKTSAVRDVLTTQIIGGGFPVIATFDFMDAGALIYAKSETDVYVGYAYGDDFVNNGAKKPYSLNDIDEEGLFHLYHDGIRPGDKEWDVSLEEAKYDQAEMGEDGDDGE